MLITKVKTYINDELVIGANGKPYFKANFGVIDYIVVRNFSPTGDVSVNTYIEVRL